MARVSLRRRSKLVRSRVPDAGVATGFGSPAGALADLPAALGGCDFVFAGLSAGAALAGGGTRAALGVGTVAGAGVGAETGCGGGAWAWAVGGVACTAAVGSAGATSGFGVCAGPIQAQPAATSAAVNPATRERREVCVPMICISYNWSGRQDSNLRPLAPHAVLSSMEVKVHETI